MGNVKIMDFGIARLMDSARITIAGGFVERPLHVSGTSVGPPGRHPIGHLFSRLIMYEIFTARVAFTGETHCHCFEADKGNTHSASAINLSAADLEKVILRCIEKIPIAISIVNELKGALSGEVPIGSTPVPRVENKISTWFSESLMSFNPILHGHTVVHSAGYLCIYVRRFLPGTAARVLEKSLDFGEPRLARITVFRLLAGIALRIYLAFRDRSEPSGDRNSILADLPTLLVLDELWRVAVIDC